MYRLTILTAALLTANSSVARATETKDKPMNYAETVAFLGKHTKVVELTDGDAQVAICPAWQGRVMTLNLRWRWGKKFRLCA